MPGRDSSKGWEPASELRRNVRRLNVKSRQGGGRSLESRSACASGVGMRMSPADPGAVKRRP